MGARNEITQRELKRKIKEDPNMTAEEKERTLCQLRKPYAALSDEELLQIVRDFTQQEGRAPERCDLLCDVVLKQRFGPWNRVLEKAGVRSVSPRYLEKRRRIKEKRARHQEYRRTIRQQEKALQGIDENV